MDRDAWDERYRDKGLLWTAEPNRFLVEAVAGLDPAAALDLAAGEGRNAVWLAQQGWRVEAVDFSEVALDKGRELAHRAGVDVDFTQVDLLDWRPATGKYDLVVIAYLHIPSNDRRRVWRAAARAVGPAGRLVIIGHDLDNLERGHGGPQSLDVLYGAAEAADIVADALDVVRAEQVIRELETDEGVRQAIDNIVVGVRR